MTKAAEADRIKKRQRIWALVSIFGFVITLLTMVYLHLESSSQLNPIRETISDYVFVHGGPRLLNISGLSLSLGSAALLTGLAGAGLIGGAPLVLFLVLWCGGLVIALIFPTDPPIGGPTSMSSAIHQTATALFTVTLPIAGYLVGRKCQLTPGWRHLARPVFRLTAVGVSVLVVFSFTYLCSEYPDGIPFGAAIRNYIGLVERVLLAIDITLLLVLGVALWRGAGAEDRSQVATMADVADRPIPSVEQARGDVG